MKLIVFGASHGVGREVVRQALAAGHEVTAFSRNPQRSGLSHDNLTFAVGDVLDAGSVEAAVAGHDAAVCTLGLPTPQAIGFPPSRRRPVLSKGTGHIMAALKLHQVQRFILLTAIGSGESRHNLTTIGRLGLRLGLPYLFAEKDRQEQLVRASSLDWTIVRPTALTNGPATSQYGVYNYPGGPSFTSGLLTQISRADVANFMVSTVDLLDHVGHAVTLSYPARFGDSLRWISNFR